jgi:Icc protein
MSNELVIAQVTDLHIGASDHFYRGINVRKQFKKVLAHLVQQPLDLLVLSGDLAAEEGEPKAYLWIREALATLPFPYEIMAGNHDHVGRLVEVFDWYKPEIARNGMFYFTRLLKGRRLVFLDSSPYRVSKAQLQWLSEELIDSKEEVLLFIHHPPLLCDCPFMDQYHCLHNINEVWSVLESLPAIKHIFCGHYHTNKSVVNNKISVYLTPSTCFQIDNQSSQFMIAHTQPGWRLIKWKGARVQTYVEYLS